MRDYWNKRSLNFTLNIRKDIFLGGRESDSSILQIFPHFRKMRFFIRNMWFFCPKLKKSAFKNAPISSFFEFIHTHGVAKG